MAQSRNLTALVLIRTDHVLGVVLLETGLTVTPVRAQRIDALGIVRADHAFVHLALVDVLAPLVLPNYEPGRTVTNVTAAFVFTYLVRATFCLAGAALVYV